MLDPHEHVVIAIRRASGKGRQERDFITFLDDCFGMSDLLIDGNQDLLLVHELRHGRVFFVEQPNQILDFFPTLERDRDVGLVVGQSLEQPEELKPDHPGSPRR